MFPKKHRFSFKEKLPKNVLNSPSFNLKYGKSDGEIKVAVIVSKRVDKRAVVRNKIKRKLLDVVKNKIAVSEPFNLIFYVKKLENTDYIFDKEIEEVIKKIKHD